MKISSKVEGESGRNQELIQKLNDLEKEWESLKKGKQQNTRRCSTGSDSSFNNSYNQLLENSPRGLMYSLQRRRSPSGGFFRVKNCDMVVEEVLRERRAAVMSGKLKGRRLFGAADGESEVELELNYDDDGGSGGSGCGGEVCGDAWLNMMGEREEAITENSDCEKGKGGELEFPDALSSSCSIPEEKKVVAEEKVVGKKRLGIGGGRGGGSCIMAMAWLVFLLILLVVGLVSISCNGKYVHENELILVPT